MQDQILRKPRDNNTNAKIAAEDANLALCGYEEMREMRCGRITVKNSVIWVQKWQLVRRTTVPRLAGGDPCGPCFSLVDQSRSCLRW